MALLRDDTSTTYWLVELAKDLQAKADEAENNRKERAGAGALDGQGVIAPKA
jgi:hypothetical protein